MSIYSPSHQAPNALNGIGDMSDGSGTINPAALNSGSTTTLTISSTWRQVLVLRARAKILYLPQSPSLPPPTIQTFFTQHLLILAVG